MVNSLNNDIKSIKDNISSHPGAFKESKRNSQFDSGESKNDRGQAASEFVKTTEINRYLIMIAKLESKIKGNTISKQELNEILFSLAKRIARLSEKETKLLAKTAEYQKLNLDFTGDLKKTFVTKFHNPADRAALFAFLKSKSLIAILKGNPQEPQVYQRQDINNNQMRKPTFSQGKKPDSFLNSGMAFMSYRENLKFNPA